MLSILPFLLFSHFSSSHTHNTHTASRLSCTQVYLRVSMAFTCTSSVTSAMAAPLRAVTSTPLVRSNCLFGVLFPVFWFRTQQYPSFPCAGKTHGGPKDDVRHVGDLGNVEGNFLSFVFSGRYSCSFPQPSRMSRSRLTFRTALFPSLAPTV